MQDFTIPITLNENEFGVSKIDMIIEAEDVDEAMKKARAFIIFMNSPVGGLNISVVSEE